MRIGYGYDVHQLRKGRKLILGGVEIPFEKGLFGHSDADVLLHAVTDALLGALALGDIGGHFPDTEEAFKNADSRKLLRESYALIKEKGYELGNLDVTVIAEQPKLQPFIGNIRKNVAEDLECSIDDVSVKATTSEKLGFAGREEGIIAQAVVLIYQRD
ncbi:MAG: 2-C-methyl-D-erythritol 2,4-cyclodiphosphate synthase [Gracilimonas sp.]|uniref:2-C-methyl-D-erythritol 2,4-cyclodiphosphate synthase n=1 Tax=Gracilimonas sp. TaxID=1974203 RepID=UPI0019AED339|nr:2-C-methyl-D-erythritol 2,4-cyclodiphosphate synthase [Gracilimonas sp.]